MRMEVTGTKIKLSALSCISVFAIAKARLEHVKLLEFARDRSYTTETLN